MTLTVAEALNPNKPNQISFSSVLKCAGIKNKDSCPWADLRIYTESAVKIEPL